LAVSLAGCRGRCMIRRMFLLGVTLVLAVVLLAACNSSTPAGSKPAPGLEDTIWVLRSYGQPGSLKPVLTGAGGMANVEITALFTRATGKVSGKSGVNTYGGDYRLEGSKISITKMMLTAMGGPQPLMDQEQAFVSLLAAADSFRISGTELQINCGTQALVFSVKK
jgi:heat shock protein HslJ